MSRVQAGDVLVTDMTDPDWEPVMKKAAAIVTNRGGGTCPAALLARGARFPPRVCGGGGARGMKKPPPIVTNRGGRTCHAAIIARELGIPAVVGCGDATRQLPEGQPVTVSCAEGDAGTVSD